MKKISLCFGIIICAVSSHAQSWNISGNLNTNPAIHFLGTRDAKALKFRVNNFPAGEIDSAGEKTFLGYRAGALSTGGGVTAIGFKALSSSNTAFGSTAIGAYSLTNNLDGYSNTAVGFGTLNGNTNGYSNTAMGYYTMTYNGSGNYNTGLGFYTLMYNYSGSYNTATGGYALHNSQIGSYNTAMGYRSLSNNVSGSYNTAYGVDALPFNYYGSYNTAVGYNALYADATAQYNTALGYRAAATHAIGWNNTILGANCGVNGTGMYNCIAIGQGVVCTASSQARIGNSATTSIGGYVGWSNISDGRFKKNVSANVKGLDFIMRLQPVTYNLDVEGIDKKLHTDTLQKENVYLANAATAKGKILYSGFVAQDVEKAAKESGYDFSGIDKPQAENDFYGLRYAEFVVPLVKAVQEQQQVINELQKKIADLEQKAFTKSIGTSDAMNVWPNPSSNVVFINFVSDQSSKAVVKMYDAKGSLVKQEQLNVLKGDNQFSIDVKRLLNGTYQLSIEWNGARERKTTQIIKY